jgi:hypothetical protein
MFNVTTVVVILLAVVVNWVLYRHIQRDGPHGKPVYEEGEGVAKKNRPVLLVGFIAAIAINGVAMNEVFGILFHR